MENTRMTSIQTLPTRGSSGANSSHEFERDAKSVSSNAEVGISLRSYTSNQEEEEEEEHHSNNQETVGARSNQIEGKSKWQLSVKKFDDEEEEEEEQYAAEDFEDDFEEENLDKSQSSPDKSFEEEEEIEEEISIGEVS